MVKMAARTVLLALSMGAAVTGLPLPGLMFFPLDPQVGNVEQVSEETLTERVAGKSCLVVGGTDGIGRGIALAMARFGASVTVVGHSQAKADAVLGDMSSVARHLQEQEFRAYAVDLLTVKGCLNFTGQLKESGARFDYAVLTVGVWPDREQPQTTDGMDKVLALDVLARFLITREILPSLNSGARVLSVLGSTVRVPPPPKLAQIKDLASGKKTRYSVSEMLGAAGIMGDAWLQGMASHHPEANVSFIGTFPGIVATGLVETSKTFPEWLRPFLGNAEKLIAISPEKSGVLHTTILSSPNPAQRPVTYFNSNLEGRLTNGLAYDADFVQWLWSFLEDTEARHGAAAELGDMTHNALVV